MKISKLCSSGSGIAEFNQQKYYFPYTAPEDAIIYHEYQNKNPAPSEYKIIANSTHRTKPPCFYYEQCGGCNLQHLNEDLYYSFKKDLGIKALTHLKQSIQDFNLVKTSLNCRRRATLKATIQDNELLVGFFKAKSNNIINIDNCILLENEINSIIPELKKVILSFNKIHFSQNFIEIAMTNCSNGLDITFKSKYEISIKERNAINNFSEKVIRATWKQDNSYNNIFIRQEPYIFINNQQVFLPVDNFLQPTLIGQEAIVAFILKYTANYKNIIDIFAGIGTYSIPISINQNSKIFAVEGNKNIKNSLQNFPNISYEIRDLYKKPIRKEKLSLFDFSIINPPRNGATPQIKCLANSTIKNIILVSCSHDTFSRDSKILIEAGFNIEDFILVDQFLFTSHVELVAYFKR